MARPIKTGTDYFPLDVELDIKMDFVESRYGNDGFSTIIKLWQKIYAENGYYCKWDNDLYCNIVSLSTKWTKRKGYEYGDQSI